MTNVELVRRIFPVSRIKEEKEDIIIDDTLRITPHEGFTKKTIRGDQPVPGWMLHWECSDVESSTSDNFAAIVIKAAEWFARWKAEQIIERIRLDEYAQQLAEERLLGVI